jgi:hypothetical protein
MDKANVEIPTELVLTAGLDTRNLPSEMAQLLALKLYREDKVSPGRAEPSESIPARASMRPFSSRRAKVRRSSTH